ncbi:type VII secretion protein EccB [Mycobacterium hodleri]|uniref:type VII secretion protein EccB n=1 Tax=Mycolicibacterium hodleri TaxID=49897 RepID=UPI0021F3C34C|nr:type VII secretion protein EccB [Mycolicibacterium hodleri]MCV7131601.1 type VII secretion protein EccB [Mycolicibacterium hodleri]
MVRQPATRLQLSGRRFLARRMMHALVRRDVAMFDDPLRAQSISLAAGGVVATLVVVAGAVVGLVRGSGVPDAAPIVMARDTGALYVRVGDTLHPVLNLASARLVARSAATPVAAAEAAIARLKRGPSMGIPGAPSSIGQPLRDPAWTVCDDDRTVVAVGRSDVDHLDSTRPVLVTPHGEGAATTYLLYEGRRAAVDLRNLAVVRALRLDGVAPVPVSRTLLDLVPEVPAIAPPPIADHGAPGPVSLPGATIGSVVTVRRTDAVERYVVLRDGLQRVGEVAADLIGYAYDTAGRPPTSVAPAAVAALPVADQLPIGSFPWQARTPVGAADGYAVCARWQPGGTARTSSNTVVASGDSPYRDAVSVTALAQADGTGPDVDAVAMPGGASADVRSARIVGDDGSTGARFLVSDAGVVFGVHDDDTATFLGLSGDPEAAPWPVLAHLPRGPELSVDAASVVRDGLPAPS